MTTWDTYWKVSIIQQAQNGCYSLQAQFQEPISFTQTWLSIS